MKEPKVLIRAEQLTKIFHQGGSPLTAVRKIDLSIYEGETVGLVGESGCGKSTLGRLLLGLLKPTEGRVYYDDREIGALSAQEWKALRREIQIIFQDPYSSLNPRMTVGEIIGEPLDIHQLAQGNRRRKRIMDLLDKVGLDSGAYARYPHEFSGGQRQRIGIARALAVEPRFIVCDEPISALDVSVQAQVINLLRSLQREMGLTYLFISHDLLMVHYLCDRVVIMNAGAIVEVGPPDQLYQHPQHPYTKNLIEAIPQPQTHTSR